MFDKLYEEVERATVHFIGYASETTRYDFAIVYTEHFFGKPLVLCMQTGKSTLLCLDDVNNLEHLQTHFGVKLDEAEELSSFFHERLPAVGLHDQY
ncbi:DUF3055 domain-containing protein [Paenibacillus sp. J2TS4]|uniref:DUF3055 domain-containing protein n=1 Tax=Paenibacillus sp. J2TS4 TaxID=2807194 RepID=UPI001B113476|nr:DUF3055 domain-containing protein [Paenibacillus sp. J2TS4]GIP32860.1 hypothetical protein J2TS4_20700 [Paenibacillus sp. J2TS4]